MSGVGKAVQELAATQHKTFAVIADEAHSSQSGEAASKLKQLLSAEEQKELGPGMAPHVSSQLKMVVAALAKVRCSHGLATAATLR